MCHKVVTAYSDGMTKKLTVQVDDTLHEQLAGAARRQGRSLHAWMLAALSHEAFRQLTAESAAWCEAHPDAIGSQTAAHTLLRRERGW